MSLGAGARLGWVTHFCFGRHKPNAPVMIVSNRYDPLVPWTAGNQLGRDWCAQGAGVQFWTNEEPPFLNKLAVNHALAMLVDGERAIISSEWRSPAW